MQIDMEKLAENLQKLGEDDLLQVVQMVHDNKTADTYTKNDVDRKASNATILYLNRQVDLASQKANFMWTFIRSQTA